MPIYFLIKSNGSSLVAYKNDRSLLYFHDLLQIISVPHRGALCVRTPAQPVPVLPQPVPVLPQPVPVLPQLVPVLPQPVPVLPHFEAGDCRYHGPWCMLVSTTHAITKHGPDPLSLLDKAIAKTASAAETVPGRRASRTRASRRAARRSVRRRQSSAAPSASLRRGLQRRSPRAPIRGVLRATSGPVESAKTISSPNRQTIRGTLEKGFSTTPRERPVLHCSEVVVEKFTV
jgi:hypothetical protein